MATKYGRKYRQKHWWSIMFALEGMNVFDCRSLVSLLPFVIQYSQFMGMMRQWCNDIVSECAFLLNQYERPHCICQLKSDTHTFLIEIFFWQQKRPCTIHRRSNRVRLVLRKHLCAGKKSTDENRQFSHAHALTFYRLNSTNQDVALTGTTIHQATSVGYICCVCDDSCLHFIEYTHRKTVQRAIKYTRKLQRSTAKNIRNSISIKSVFFFFFVPEYRYRIATTCIPLSHPNRAKEAKKRGTKNEFDHRSIVTSTRFDGSKHKPVQWVSLILDEDYSGSVERFKMLWR